MIPGTIIKGYFSKCCDTSISGNNGLKDLKGIYLPHYYTCNKCKKVTTAIIKDSYIITDKGKY